jgi:hypothetical protein
MRILVRSGGGEGHRIASRPVPACSGRDGFEGVYAIASYGQDVSRAACCPGVDHPHEGCAPAPPHQMSIPGQIRRINSARDIGRWGGWSRWGPWGFLSRNHAPFQVATSAQNAVENPRVSRQWTGRSRRIAGGSAPGELSTLEANGRVPRGPGGETLRFRAAQIVNSRGGGSP